MGSLALPGAPRTHKAPARRSRSAVILPVLPVTMRAITLVVCLIALTCAELPVLSEGSGDDSDELFGDDDEGSGEFIEDLKAFGDHNKVLKVVPDSDDFDIHFGKDDDYYGDDESYTEMIDSYDYEEREDDSVLKVLKDEEKVVEMDIEIKPKPPSTEDELLLDTAQILIMVGSAFISFGVVMLAFFLCRQRLESSRKEKAMPYTIPARSVTASTSPIVKNYQRVPTSTQQLLASPPHIEMYREEKAASPLLP